MLVVVNLLLLLLELVPKLPLLLELQGLPVPLELQQLLPPSLGLHLQPLVPPRLVPHVQLLVLFLLDLGEQTALLALNQVHALEQFALPVVVLLRLILLLCHLLLQPLQSEDIPKPLLGLVDGPLRPVFLRLLYVLRRLVDLLPQTALVLLVLEQLGLELQLRDFVLLGPGLDLLLLVLVVLDELHDELVAVLLCLLAPLLVLLLPVLNLLNELALLLGHDLLLLQLEPLDQLPLGLHLALLLLDDGLDPGLELPLSLPGEGLMLQLLPFSLLCKCQQLLL